MQTLTGTLAASALLTRRSEAREKYGRWDKESVIKYSMDLINWAKKDMDGRASLLKQLVDIEVDLGFKYFHGTLERKEGDYHKRFLDGRLAANETEKHIAAFLKDIEAVRVVLAKKEAEAVPMWKDGGALAGGSLKEGKVFDTSLSSRNLGVIVDRSPSMTPHIEKLRAEVERDFAGCHIVEVDGCEIFSPHYMRPVRKLEDSAWFFAAPADGINPFTPDRHCPGIPQQDAHVEWWYWNSNTLAAHKAMAALMKVDAIYWFCDFDDPTDGTGISILKSMILASKIRLFIHTLDKNPDKHLAAIVEASGGKLIKKRLR
jgi:hypothetical protein